MIFNDRELCGVKIPLQIVVLIFHKLLNIVHNNVMLRNVFRGVSKISSRIRSTPSLFVVNATRQNKQKYSTDNTANDIEQLGPPKNASAEDLDKWMKNRPIAKNVSSLKFQKYFIFIICIP